MKYQILPYSAETRIKIYASLSIEDNFLKVTYELEGDLSWINIRDISQNPQRRYDLWEETCFEMFVKRPDKEDYIEFNFSPSGDWNSFQMTHFRNNVGELQSVKSISIKTELEKSKLELVALISMDEIFDYSAKLFCSNTLQVGLTAVIKAKLGELSYWAIHPVTPRPDFHDKKTFDILRLI